MSNDVGLGFSELDVVPFDVVCWQMALLAFPARENEIRVFLPTLRDRRPIGLLMANARAIKKGSVSVFPLQEKWVQVTQLIQFPPFSECTEHQHPFQSFFPKAKSYLYCFSSFR